MKLHTLLTLVITLALASAGCLGGSDESAEDDATPTDGDGTGAEDDANADADGATGDDADGTSDDAGTDEGNATATPAPAPVSLSVQTSGTYPLDPGYAPAELDAPAGAEVTLTFTNAEQVPVASHDWVLEDVTGAQTDAIAPGESTEITFTAPAEPGTYAYYCSVGDHRERGMEGTFTVTG